MIAAPDAPTDPKLFLRFWTHVALGDGCWLWTAATFWDGYGQFSIRANGRRVTVRAHRMAYELVVGTIPVGLTLDHLCRNRLCVRPDHLDPASKRENTLRSPVAVPALNALKAQCLRNHDLTGANLRITPRGARACKACAAHWAREYRHQRRLPR